MLKHRQASLQYLYRGIALLFMLIFFAICTQLHSAVDNDGAEGEKSDSVQITTPDIGIESDNWELVWADEFNADMPDPEIWEINVRPRHQSWQTKDNVYCKDGILYLKMLPVETNGKPSTGAGITTRGKTNFFYGKTSARIRLFAEPYSGAHPAFWSLGENLKNKNEPEADGVVWPFCGELDIFEWFSHIPDKVKQGPHTGKYNHRSFKEEGGPRPKASQVPIDRSQWHVYSVVWTEDKVDFYIDDRKTLTYKNEGTGENQYPFVRPQFVILHIKSKDNQREQAPGNPPPRKATLEVDWVRYYKQKK